MRSTRTPIAVIIAAGALMLACSEDDSSPADPDDASGSSTSSTSTSGATSDTDTDTDTDALPEMVYVPAGAFKMGCNPQLVEACHHWAVPENTIELDGFSIDTTEVTQAEYATCVAEGGCTPVDASDCLPGGEPPPPWADNPAQNPNYPVVCVTVEQAEAFCNWEDKRLPTEAEWEKAARGDDPDGIMYPWGNDVPTGCERARIGGCGDSPMDVGQLPLGESKYGARDMVGNVAEFTRDRFGWRYYWDLQAQADVSGGPVRNPPGHQYVHDRTIRGTGFPYDLGVNGPDSLSVWRRHWWNNFRKATEVGFRCVQPDVKAECGNGVLEPSERCDDGNDIGGDGCENDCEASGAAQAHDDWPGYRFIDAASAGAGPDGAPRIVSVVTTNDDATFTLYGFGWAEGMVGSADDALPDQFAKAIAVLSNQEVVVVGAGTVGATQDAVVWVFQHDFEEIEELTPPWRWTREGTDGADEARDVVARSDGTIIVVGRVQTPTTGFDAWIAAIDPAAPAGSELLWEQTFDGGSGGSDAANGVALAADGTIVVTGQVTVEGRTEIWTAKYSADGATQQWSTTWNSGVSPQGPLDPGDAGQAVVVAPSGAIYTAARALEENTDLMMVETRMALLKLDAAGSVLWTEVYEDDGEADAIALTPDEDPIVSASVVVKWDKAGGDPVWVSEPGPAGDQIRTLAPLEDGRMAWAGFHDQGGGVGILGGL